MTQPKYTIHPQNNRRVGAAHTVKRIMLDMWRRLDTPAHSPQSVRLASLRSHPVDSGYDEDSEWTASFVTVDDTNVTLDVVSVGDVHTFTVGWTGLLAASRGGTGIGGSGGLGHLLTGDGAGGWTSAAPGGGGSPHDLLDHTDAVYTTPPARGSMVVGNSANLWEEFLLGTAGKVLYSDGTDAIWQALGLNEQVLFNDGGAPSGDTAFTWDKATHVLTLGIGSGVAGSIWLRSTTGGGAARTQIQMETSAGAIDNVIRFGSVDVFFPISTAPDVATKVEWLRSDDTGQLEYSSITVADIDGGVDFSDLTGEIDVSQMDGGTGADATTFWRGDGSWAVPIDTDIFHIIRDKDAAADMAQRAKLSFGGQVALADNAGGNETAITIPGMVEQAEESVNSGTDTTEITTNPTSLRLYYTFTLPTTYGLYVITGIEWKNGTVSAGSTQCGVEMVNANPPSAVSTLNLVVGMLVANGLANSTQRQSFVTPVAIRGGTVLSAWIQANSTTHRYRSLVVASANNRKTITFTSDPPHQDVTAWTASTAAGYIKVYYRGYI